MKKDNSDIKLSIRDFGEKNFHLIKGVYVHKNIENIDTPIFRYMKFEHLLSILKKQKLYIPNKLMFPDLRERGYKEYLPFIFNLQPVARSKEGRERNKREYDNEQAAKKVCVSCWTYDIQNNSQKTEDILENYLMWKAYAYQETGCRIESSIQDLIGCIKEPKKQETILLANVIYEKEGWDNCFDSVFKKAPYYFYEQEVRLCVLTSEGYIKLPIDPFKLIKKITFSPFVSKEYADFHISKLTNKYPELENKIESSHILEYPINK